MIVTLLTDYGRDDDFVGVCHGVIAGIAPDARDHRPDPRHPAPRRAPRRAGAAQRAALHAGRRARGRGGPAGGHRAARLALRCDDGRVLVGPDNGLLSLAWQRGRRRGRGGGREPLAAPARAGVGHLPRPRRVRAGGGAPRGGRRARRTPASRWTPTALRELELPQPRQEGDDAGRARARARTASATPALNAEPRRIWPRRASRWAARSRSSRGGGHAPAPPSRSTFADVAGGRAARLRGRVPARWRSRSTAATPPPSAGPRARRRGARSRARMIGAPARAPPRLRTPPTQRAKELAARGRAPRHAGHRRRADRRAAGARAGRGWRRPGRALLMSLVRAPGGDAAAAAGGGAWRVCEACEAERPEVRDQVAERRAGSSGARWRGSWSRAGRRRAGRCWGSG